MSHLELVICPRCRKYTREDDRCGCEWCRRPTGSEPRPVFNITRSQIAPPTGVVSPDCNELYYGKKEKNSW